MLVERIGSGRPIAHVAAEMGISRKTADQVVAAVPGGGCGRPRGPLQPASALPASTPARVERQIIRLCVGGANSGRPGSRASWALPASTVHQVLVRHGMNRLAWMDRPSGQVIRRIHTDRPGELVHVDVKKLGRIPPGGGWEMPGRTMLTHHSQDRVGYDFIHSAIDAHTRLAFSEVLSDEKGPTCAGFFERAEAFFAAHDIDIEAVLTDNARNYLGKDFTAALGRSSTEGSDPADPRPTARWNGSTAPSSTSGPTSGSTPQMRSGPEHLTAGSTPTTIIEAIRLSEAGSPIELTNLAGQHSFVEGGRLLQLE